LFHDHAILLYRFLTIAFLAIMHIFIVFNPQNSVNNSVLFFFLFSYFFFFPLFKDFKL